MRIGIVTTWFERGAAYVSRSFFETLSQEHEVYIYARGGEQSAICDPIWDRSYVTWGKSIKFPSPTPVNWKDFEFWVRNNRLEIVIFNEQQDWDVIVRSSQMFSDVRIGAYIDYYTQTTIPFFKLYDFVICNTKRHYEIFRSHPQSLLIPWGTNIDIYKPIQKDRKVNQVVFFHSCGLSHFRKGTDLLVDAFELVTGATRLVIHSQMAIPDAILRERILQNPKINLIEKVIGVPGQYYMGDIYVYPSRLDGIGLTIVEALSSGLPVITTDDAPMNEFVQHGINGRLANVASHKYREDNYYWPMSECDIDSLATEMQFYVDNIVDLRHYQQLAREFAIMNLDWKKNSNFLPQWIETTSFTRSKLTLLETIKMYNYDFLLNWGSINRFIWFFMEKLQPKKIFNRILKVLKF